MKMAFLTPISRSFGHSISKDCPPYENEYYASRDVTFRSQRLADIAGFYHAFNLDRSSTARDRIDHLSFEAEFVQILIARQLYATDQGLDDAHAESCRQAQRRFFAEHLGWWLPAFGNHLEAAYRLHLPTRDLRGSSAASPPPSAPRSVCRRSTELPVAHPGQLRAGGGMLRVSAQPRRRELAAPRIVAARRTRSVSRPAAGTTGGPAPIEYEPGLIEDAVRWVIEQGGFGIESLKLQRLRFDHRRKRDVLYRLPEGEQREAAFRNHFATLFAELGNAAWIPRWLEPFPRLSSELECIVVRAAAGPGEDGAELWESQERRGEGIPSYLVITVSGTGLRNHDELRAVLLPDLLRAAGRARPRLRFSPR